MFEDRKNYYEVLEVEMDSSLQDIHNAYERAKNAYSGESVAMYSLISQDECEAILQQIEEAYSILGTPEKRLEYDKARGFNQSNTPDGFNESLQEKPDYKPRSNIHDLLDQTETTDNSSERNQSRSSDFEYNSSHSNKAQSSVSKVSAFKKFGLEYEQDPQVEQEIDNCSNYTGSFLRKIREYKNVSIERMAEMTRISKTYIKNIEEENFENLPALVYTRGFVYQYAKCLKLNPDLVATSFIHNMKQSKTEQA